VSDLLSIGRTGLMASKKSLETTGHNIANANTEGYSRQRVVQTTGSPIIKEGFITGTGARVNGTKRFEAPLLEKRLKSSISNNQFHKEKATQLERVENIFSEVNGESLNQVLGNFFNSFRELSNHPENDSIKSIVRDNAEFVIKDFSRITGDLENISRGIDSKIGTEIENINQNLNEIAKLNTQITKSEASGDQSGDLLDQRDLALRTLSESFQVTAYVDGKNRFVVNAEGVGTLVSAGQVQELAVAGNSKEKASNNMAGGIEVVFKNRPLSNITHRFQKGRVASLLDTRNKDIGALKNSIDDIAYNFAREVNYIHRQGVVDRPVELDQNGNMIKEDYKGKTTGIDFFSTLSDRENASTELKLHSLIQEDTSNISTGLTPNASGDNRVALDISKLQYKKLLNGGTATFEEQYLKSISNLGVKSGKAQLNSEQSEGLLSQAQSLKEKITGVSIDEEAANMIRFQHAYQASAKVLQSADEMFDTVLAIKR